MEQNGLSTGSYVTSGPHPPAHRLWSWYHINSLRGIYSVFICFLTYLSFFSSSIFHFLQLPVPWSSRAIEILPQCNFCLSSYLSESRLLPMQLLLYIMSPWLISVTPSHAGFSSLQFPFLCFDFLISFWSPIDTSWFGHKTEIVLRS